MTQRAFISVAGAVFAVIALVHAVRLLVGWTVVLNGWTVPPGVSWAAVAVFGALAYVACQLRRSGR